MLKKTKRLSIIIPVFNEENFIAKCLVKIVEADSLGLKKEVVVIDDGSTDSSWRKIRRFAGRQPRTKLVKKQPNRVRYTGKIDWILIRQGHNQGKGAVVRQGIKLSSGDIVLVQDADLEYNPDNYPSLLAPILSDQADVVYGSRFLGCRPHRVLYFNHYLGNKIITWWSNLWTGLNLTDIEVGYKAFRADIIGRLSRNLKSDGFGFEAEVTAKLARLKEIRIYEVGVDYWGRTYAEGKKISWLDGLRAFWQIVWYRFF